MDEWVCSSGGMVLTGENGCPGRKTLYSVGGRWMDEYGAMVEWYWQGKTEVLGEKHYTVWVVDGWMSMDQWWNDTDRGKLKCWEKTRSQVHVNHTHKRNSHVPVSTSLHYKDQPVHERQQSIPWHQQHKNTERENKVYTERGRGKYSYHCPNDRHGHWVRRVRHTHTLSKKRGSAFFSLDSKTRYVFKHSLVNLRNC